MKPVFVGIDVAVERGQTFVAIDEDLKIVGISHGISDVSDVDKISRKDLKDLTDRILELKPAIIAIDSPPSLALSDNKYREAEKRLRDMNISIHYTPSRKSSREPADWMKVGFAIFKQFEQVSKKGYSLYLGKGPKCNRLIEIYPYASYVTLSRTLRRGSAKAEWTKKIVESRFKGKKESDTILNKLTNQDMRDAFIAAYTAYCFYNGNFSPVGDKDEGIIILPVKENDLLARYT